MGNGTFCAGQVSILITFMKTFPFLFDPAILSGQVPQSPGALQCHHHLPTLGISSSLFWAPKPQRWDLPTRPKPSSPLNARSSPTVLQGKQACFQLPAGSHVPQSKLVSPTTLSAVIRRLGARRVSQIRQRGLK